MIKTLVLLFAGGAMLANIDAPTPAPNRGKGFVSLNRKTAENIAAEVGCARIRCLGGDKWTVYTECEKPRHVIIYSRTGAETYESHDAILAGDGPISTETIDWGPEIVVEE